MALTGALIATFLGCDGDEAATDTAAGGGGSSASSSSSSSTSASSTSSSGVVSSSSSSGGQPIYLALPCSSNEQCGPQGRCITPADDDPVLGGGAVGGYCTADCVTAADCAGVGSPCVDGTCLLSCIIGPELTYIDDPLDGSKCHGREDLRCAPSENGEVCLPTCGSDSQCPGRFCDPRFGVCVDSPSTGNPTGTVCNENLPDPGCAGFCQTFTNSIESICTSPCVLGGELDALDCGGLSNGLCVYRPSGYGAGDFGRCAAACTQHDQCGNPDWWCFSTSFTSNGFCFTAEDCTSSAGCEVDEACVATAYGLKCLEWDPPSCGAGGSGGSAGNGCDTLFPLGSAAPGGGGAGGAGGSTSAGGAGGAGGSTGGAGGSTGGAGGSTSAGGAGGAGGSTGGAGGT